MLGCLALLTVGSVLCGAATSMNFLVAGRSKLGTIVCIGSLVTYSTSLVVQGMGGGGAASTCAIVISDLVPLRQRGVYNGYIGM
jgi:MFS family permease